MITKTISLLMSLVLLLLSTNTNYAAHYCGGEIVKQSFLLGKKELSCQGMLSVKSCVKQNHDTPIIKRKSCCENKYISISSEKDYQKTYGPYLPKLTVNQIGKASFISLFTFLSVKNIKYQFYRPPPKIFSFQVFFQVFRI